MKSSTVLSFALALLICALSACSPAREARTPQEFVEEYSKAWKSGDVETILALRSQKKLVDVGLKPNMKEALDQASLDDEREEIEQSIKRRDFGYVSWSMTEFVSARDHEDHVHVDVRVGGANSAIVLVRDGELLKIHPDPSSFQ
jgi:hypothetical protein